MKRLMIFFLLMAMAAFSAAGQVYPKTAELGWLELPAFSEDPEHFFVSHHTDDLGRSCLVEGKKNDF